MAANIHATTSDLAQNAASPATGTAGATYEINASTPIEVYIDMTQNMELSFDRTDFTDSDSVFGVLYIKPNAFALSAAASITGFGDLDALTTGEYNAIFYISPPSVDTAEVR